MPGADGLFEDGKQFALKRPMLPRGSLPKAMSDLLRNFLIERFIALVPFLVPSESL